ncbi:hypothetical protein GOP47_0025512 [Adiantum capillus-veneris]|uniref:NAD(P)-binding protein n=1 Tax=Adiantum capillus-veneris TaxID=13818 RepID=A0A9D4U1F6_ADICA|nr:hypothetical protein GOP47_0025512 [Adiantum capillus-veneris]
MSRPHLAGLKGKHVVITGGSSGIGLAIAQRCAAEGAFLTLISRSSSKLAAARHHIASSLSCNPDRIQTKIADTSNATTIISAIEESFEWKPIDVLICNAGLAMAGMMGDVKEKDLDLVTKTNFLGCVYPIHAAIPLMKQRSLQNPSSIVIMSSLAGLVPLYGINVYSPTKYALKGLAELLLLELLPWNIRVNLVCPSFTKTNLLEEEYFGGNEIIRTIGRKLYSYNHKALESSDDVAMKTIEGVKTGEFLIFTNAQGASLGPLTRGLIPSESVGTFIIELLLMVPYRFVSLLWFLNAKKLVHKMNSKTM